MRAGPQLLHGHSCQVSVCVCPQRETLLRQLETNQLDMDATLEELCVQQETEDQNYEMYSTFFPCLCAAESENTLQSTAGIHLSVM